MFWRQDKEVSENPESKRIQTQIAEWTELAAERQGVLDRAEKLHTEARLTVGTLYSRIAGQVDEALAPEYRRYSAAQSVLDERIEEDRRRAAEAEAERRAEEIRRRVDAEIEPQKREGIGWQVSVQDGVVPTWWSDGKSPQEDETKEATKDELQEREAQANREKDRGFDMMD